MTDQSLTDQPITDAPDDPGTAQANRDKRRVWLTRLALASAVAIPQTSPGAGRRPHAATMRRDGRFDADTSS